MPAQMPVASGKFSMWKLCAIVVGSMIGGGIFTLPHSFARTTGPVGALIAWTIAGAGMFMIARVLQILAERKPNLDVGIYTYARAGFGDYVGFLSVFGYWLASCMGSTTYWILVKATLGGFFPVFGDGSTVAAIVAASIGIWAFHFLILRGVPQAALINKVATVAKVLPIIAFILILLLLFDVSTFRDNVAKGMAGPDLATQVRSTMLITLYAFLGIEGASIYSRYAKKRSDVGRATLLGLAAVTTLLVLVTILPYGVLDQDTLARLRQPSMASVLGLVVGRWGAIFISVGLIISVMGAYLAWSLVCAEVLFSAAHKGDMPKIFATENSRHVPAAALWLTNIVIQVMVISTYWSDDPYKLMLLFTSQMSLAPYLLVALFGVLFVWRGETYDLQPIGRKRDLLFGLAASAYGFFLVAASGLAPLLYSAILYAAGTGFYLWARRERARRVFALREWAVFAAVAASAAAGLHLLATISSRG
jgi:arginine:ornithine antiporter/lysine permease